MTAVDYDFDSSGDDAHGWRRIKEKTKEEEEEEGETRTRTRTKKKRRKRKEERKEERKGPRVHTDHMLLVQKNVRICSICGST